MTLTEAVWLAKNEGKSSSIKCPAHDDGSPSLSVSAGSSQPVILRCHAGCLTADILTAGGLVMADICDPDQPIKPRPLVAPKPTAKDRLAWLATTVSEGIQSRYGVTPSELAWSSPNRLEGVPEPQLWRVFLSTLYRPDDVVWIGDKTDSGQPHHASNFRRVSDWLESEPAGRLVSLSTFKAGSISRGNDSIDQHRFIVLESDSLPISKQPAAINFCREFTKLKAIIHSGNKSLHAWFERPADDVLDQLKVILPALGIDLAGLDRPAQPYRMPGFARETGGGFTGLLWLDRKDSR